MPSSVIGAEITIGADAARAGEALSAIGEGDSLPLSHAARNRHVKTNRCMLLNEVAELTHADLAQYVPSFKRCELCGFLSDIYRSPLTKRRTIDPVRPCTRVLFADRRQATVPKD